MLPVLQHHLLKILYKLNIQPLQWQMVFQRLITPLTGSQWNTNDLVIVLATSLPDPKDIPKEHEENVDDLQLGKKLTSALLQAERGLVIVGDLQRLGRRSGMWGNFVDWMVGKRLVVDYNVENK